MGGIKHAYKIYWKAFGGVKTILVLIQYILNHLEGVKHTIYMQYVSCHRGGGKQAILIKYVVNHFKNINDIYNFMLLSVYW